MAEDLLRLQTAQQRSEDMLNQDQRLSIWSARMAQYQQDTKDWDPFSVVLRYVTSQKTDPAVWSSVRTLAARHAVRRKLLVLRNTYESTLRTQVIEAILGEIDRDTMYPGGSLNPAYSEAFDYIKAAFDIDMRSAELSTAAQARSHFKKLRKELPLRVTQIKSLFQQFTTEENTVDAIDAKYKLNIEQALRNPGAGAREIGSEIRSLETTIEQVKSLLDGLKAEKVEGVVPMDTGGINFATAFDYDKEIQKAEEELQDAQTKRTELLVRSATLVGLSSAGRMPSGVTQHDISRLQYVLSLIHI